MSATLPEQIQRVRMALAEVGIPADAVLSTTEPGFYASWDLTQPWDLLWRARETAEFRDAACFACWIDGVVQSLPDVGEPDPCVATRRFVQDCGVDRSAIGSEVVASPPRVAASDRVAEPRADPRPEHGSPVAPPP